MAKTLFIIESPGKKAKLESILGPDYIVRASFGHIRDLPENELGVDPPSFRPRYEVSDRAKKTVAALRKAAAEADRVLLATDLDREGEAIAWHIADALKLKNPQRITYDEISAKAVLAALKATRPLNMHLVHAQEARRVLDRLVGYMVSAPLSNKAGQRLSAGRVQTPAVRLVVDRERAIRAFVPTHHFGAELRFVSPAAFKAQWLVKPHLQEQEEYLQDESLANAAADVATVVVVACENSTKHVPPPPPFTTSTLQRAAQAKLKFKPKRTMELAQRLYELGAITYMRTDSPNLSDDACADIAAYANAASLRLSPKRRAWKAKAGAQEAHEAIRPAHIADRDAGESEDERSLYRLIWSRAVASQLIDAEFAERSATLESARPIAGDIRARYIAKGSTLVDKGWKALYDDSGDDAADDAGEANAVPSLAHGCELTVAAGSVLRKTTEPPRRFTESSLIGALEAEGIGRPATYAAILDNITTRGYIVEDRKGFLTPAGGAEAIVDTLQPVFDFVALEYTRDLESDLDEIASGQKDYRTVVAAAYDRLRSQVATIAPAETPDHPCPTCGKAMRRRTGSRGAFWGCTGYPVCTTTAEDLGGAPGAIHAARAESKPPPRSSSTGGVAVGSGGGGAASGGHRCPNCKKPLRHNVRAAADDPKGKGWDFWGCTGYPKCKSTFQAAVDGSPVIAAGNAAKK